MSVSPVPAQVVLDEKNTDPRQVEDVVAGKPSGGLVEDAKNAADAEHTMSLWKAIQLYPNAIGWSVLLSSTLIMEGRPASLNNLSRHTDIFRVRSRTFG